MDTFPGGLPAVPHLRLGLLDRLEEFLYHRKQASDLLCGTSPRPCDLSDADRLRLFLSAISDGDFATAYDVGVEEMSCLRDEP